MAFDPNKINSTVQEKSPAGIIYGIGGIGKTTWAYEWPSPLYLPTLGEEPPAGVPKGENTIETIGDLFDAFDYLLGGDHKFKTLIIDSLDGLEPLVWKQTCARNGWTTIEEPGYGKGYAAADEEWREIIGGVQALRAAGIATIFVAHQDITRFESPTSEPFSRYGLKLQKRASALMQESVQFVGFMKYRETVKKEDVGFNKKVTRAEGSGERVIHFEERPGFLAKNRYSMPPQIPYKIGEGYKAVSKYFPLVE